MMSWSYGRKGCSSQCSTLVVNATSTALLFRSLLLLLSLEMPHHCAVPGCASNSSTSPSLSFHQFPDDKQLRKVWLVRIRRDERAGEFSINKWTRICSLHFEDEDYQEPSRQRNRQTSRKNRHLKKTAVPSKFRQRVGRKQTQRRTVCRHAWRPI